LSTKQKEAVMQAYRLLSAGNFTEVEFPDTHIKQVLCEFTFYTEKINTCQ